MKRLMAKLVTFHPHNTETSVICLVTVGKQAGCGDEEKFPLESECYLRIGTFKPFSAPFYGGTFNILFYTSVYAPCAKKSKNPRSTYPERS